MLVATLSTGLLAATAAKATLVGSADGKTVYDPDTNLTWISNGNLAATETFGLAYEVDLGTIPGKSTPGGSYIYKSELVGGHGFNTGTMTWGGAVKWIGAMNAANYLGYSDWRLPSASNTGASSCYTCSGYIDKFSGEFSHLYIDELGNSTAYQYGSSRSGSYVYKLDYGQYGLINDPNNPNDESLFHNLSGLSSVESHYWSDTESDSTGNNAYTFYFGEGSQYGTAKGYGWSGLAIAVRSGQIATVPVPAAAWFLTSGLLGLIGVARRKIA